MLSTKINELNKELLQLKRDYVNTSICQTDRSFLARSVSPTQASISFVRTDRKNNILNKTTTNLGKIISKLGTSRYKNVLSPTNQDTNMSIDKSIVQTSENQTIKTRNSPIKMQQKMISEKERLSNTVQDLPPTSYKNKNMKIFKNYGEDSFLKSPRLDGISFLAGCNDQSLNKTCVNDSIYLPNQNGNSSYNIRCKNCLKIFDQVEKFVEHKNKCIKVNDTIEEITQNSDLVNVQSSESPDMRRNYSDAKFQTAQVKSSISKQIDLRRQCSNFQLVKSNFFTKSSTPKYYKQPQTVKKSKTRNGDLLNNTSSKKSATVSFPNNRYNYSSKIVNEPQIILTNQDQSLNNIVNGFSEQATLPQSTRNVEDSNISLFQIQQHHKSDKRTTDDLEKENQKLMIELKQAKIDLALCQERSSANELQFKKEIINLQYQLSILMKNQGTNQQQKSSFASNQNNSNQFTPFNGANINIQTTNVTCFNIGCGNITNQTDYGFSQKCQTTPIHPRVQQQQPQQQQTETNIKNCQDQLSESPQLNKEDVIEDTFKEKNQPVRITRIPTFMLKKCQPK